MINILKLEVSKGKSALVNFDNVTEIHSRESGGCDIYFNALSNNEEQAYIQVTNSMDDIELNINAIKE